MLQCYLYVCGDTQLHSLLRKSQMQIFFTHAVSMDTASAFALRCGHLLKASNVLQKPRQRALIGQDISSSRVPCPWLFFATFSSGSHSPTDNKVVDIPEKIRINRSCELTVVTGSALALAFFSKPTTSDKHRERERERENKHLKNGAVSASRPRGITSQGDSPAFNNYHGSKATHMGRSLFSRAAQNFTHNIRMHDTHMQTHTRTLAHTTHITPIHLQTLPPQTN